MDIWIKNVSPLKRPKLFQLFHLISKKSASKISGMEFTAWKTVAAEINF